MYRRFEVPILALLVALGSDAATAGGDSVGFGSIVYDPTNHAENAITAVQSVRQTATQLQSYALQIRQYLATLENLKRIPQSALDDVLRPYREELAGVESLYRELRGAHGELLKLQRELDHHLRQIGSMKMDPKAYLEYEMKLSQRRGQGFDAAFQGNLATLQSVNQSYQRIKTLQSHIAGSVGALQSMQTMNEHLNLLAGQNAELITLVASSEASLAAKAKQDAERAASGAQFQRSRLQREGEGLQALRDALRRSELESGWGLMK
jgi:type IV secretion system protein TrbJ